MRHLLLALTMAALSACAAGMPYQEAACPPADQGMTRAQWEACYGHQDDEGTGADR